MRGAAQAARPQRSRLSLDDGFKLARRSALWALLLQRNRELGLAGVGGIVERLAGAVAFGGAEVDAVLDAGGESSEAGFTVGVGAEFEVELADVHESVGDVDIDFGRVERGTRCEVMVRSAEQGPMPPSITGTALGSGAGVVWQIRTAVASRKKAEARA